MTARKSPEEINHPFKKDRDAIHRVLYRRADRHGRLVLQVNKICDDIGITVGNFYPIIDKFVAQGRMRQIGGGQYRVKTFIIENPEKWQARWEITQHQQRKPD